MSERPFKFSVTLPPAACPDCRLQILFTRKRRLKSPRYVSKTELCAQIVELAVFIKTDPHCERKKFRAGENTQVILFGGGSAQEFSGSVLVLLGH